MLDKYFKLLGLSPGASKADIKSAYRKKAKELHPDTSKKSQKAAETEFKELNEAYIELMKNKAKSSKISRQEGPGVYEAMDHKRRPKRSRRPQRSRRPKRSRRASENLRTLDSYLEQLINSIFGSSSISRGFFSPSRKRRSTSKKPKRSSKRRPRNSSERSHRHQHDNHTVCLICESRRNTYL